jgi:hypothetical protein
MTTRNVTELLTVIAIKNIHDIERREFMNSYTEFNTELTPFFVSVDRKTTIDIDEDGDEWFEEENDDALMENVLQSVIDDANANWGEGNWDGLQYNLNDVDTNSWASDAVSCYMIGQ